MADGTANKTQTILAAKIVASGDVTPERAAVIATEKGKRTRMGIYVGLISLIGGVAAWRLGAPNGWILGLGVGGAFLAGVIADPEYITTAISGLGQAIGGALAAIVRGKSGGTQ